MKTSTILALGGGAILLYLLTKPSVPPPTLYQNRPPGYSGSGSSLTAAEVAAGASVANNLIDLLGGSDNTPSAGNAPAPSSFTAPGQTINF